MPQWGFFVRAGFTRDILVPRLRITSTLSCCIRNCWIHYNLLPLLYRNLVGKSISIFFVQGYSNSAKSSSKEAVSDAQTLGVLTHCEHTRLLHI